MVQWKYQRKILKNDQIPEDAVGFIYKITRKSDGKLYIGKKLLAFKRKKKLTKAEKLLPENKRKIFKTVITDSGWESYWGSCKELVEDVKNLGEQAFTKEILHFCFSKKDLTYKEVKIQFEYNVLESNSYNGNILSRFFRAKTEQNAK